LANTAERRRIRKREKGARAVIKSRKMISVSLKTKTTAVGRGRGGGGEGAEKELARGLSEGGRKKWECSENAGGLL
jgi:hypothetical protein